MDIPTTPDELLKQMRRLRDRIVELYAWIGVANDELARNALSHSALSWHSKDQLVSDICDADARFWSTAMELGVTLKNSCEGTSKNRERIAARAGELMDSVADLRIR